MKHRDTIKSVDLIHELLKNLAVQSTSLPDRFFKTEKDGYAAHDQFLGVAVPELRKVAKQFSSLNLNDIHVLLYSSFNEERLLALFVLVDQFKKSDEQGRKERYDFYMAHIQQVNNWNLVDSSAHLILGAYLENKDKAILYTLAQSSVLWERRIAIVSTLHFIRLNQVNDTYNLAKILLHDLHDLIHKAVGWMLREAGKKNMQELKQFLDGHASHMPRTMLRYAIEKLSADERQKYLQIKNK